MKKKAKKKNPLKLKACVVALSLWGLSAVLTLSSSPVMAAETASNTAQERVAKALFNKGVDLAELHRYEEAIAVDNDLITRFGNSQDTTIQEQVAKALLNKGVVLAELHRIGQARAEWEELVYRFKDNPDVDIQKDVATARHLLLVTRNL